MTDGSMPRRRSETDVPRSGSFGRISSGVAARSRSVVTALVGKPTESAMRAARRRWASGVTIVTTLGEADNGRRFRGATVSAFTVVSLVPPLVLICLEREAATARAIRTAGVFAVSVLDRAQEFQADQFAGLAPLPDARFTGIPYDLAETGCPILRGSLAWFDCRLAAIHDGGDHLIFVGEVVAVGIGEDTDDPLLNYEGSYRRIEGA